MWTHKINHHIQKAGEFEGENTVVIKEESNENNKRLFRAWSW